MDALSSGIKTPTLTPVDHIANTAKSNAAPPTVDAPPPTLAPQDVNEQQQLQQAHVATVSTGFQDIQTATAEDLRTFVDAFKSHAANSVVRTGDALMISAGSGEAARAIKVPLSVLTDAIKTGAIDRHSPLMHSLQLYEAAYNAGLSNGAANAIIRGYRARMEQGIPPHEALLRSMTSIAVAGQVEAYVENQNGLASDMRRTAEFTKDAFDGQAAGGTLRALKNRTVRADVIRTAQMHLDDKLHRFTAAFANARQTGDYDTAFDAMEAFFRTSAGVAETDYWRQRPATVLAALQSSRPPGPRDGQPPLTFTDALPEVVAKPRDLRLPEPKPIKTATSIFGHLSETVRAGWAWLRGREARASMAVSHPGIVAVHAKAQASDDVAVQGRVWQRPVSSPSASASASLTARPVLGASYLRRFTASQGQAIARLEAVFTSLKAPLTNSQARQAYETQAQAGVKAMIDAGIPRDEANAIRAQFERQYVSLLNPDLAGVVGNPQYDLANDPTVSALTPESFAKFLNRLDFQGALAQELREAVTDFVMDRTGVDENDVNQAIRSGQVSDREIVAFLRAKHPDLLKDCHRALDVTMLPVESRALALTDRSEDLSDADLLKLLGTTDTGQGPKTILDKLAWNGASGMGASPGADDTRGRYNGLSDSAVRMENRMKLFRDLSGLVDQPDYLEAGLTVRRNHLEKAMANARKALEEARKASQRASTHATKAAANFKRLTSAQQVVKLRRELHDLNTVAGVLRDAVASGAPRDHQGFRTLEAMAAMSPLERFVITAYTSELYNIANNNLRFALTSVNSTDKPHLLGWIKATQSALNKLPSYVGTTYRQDASNDRQNLVQAGNQVGDKAFVSTASALEGTQGAAQRGMLSISKVTGGKVIADLSHFGAAEREVLMPPFSTFAVEARIDRPSDGDWAKALAQPENARLLQDYGVDVPKLLKYLELGAGSQTKTIALQRQV